MTRDTKVIGRVYKHLTDNIEKYFTRSPRLYKYDQFKSALLKAGMAEFDGNNDFPIDFYAEMCDVALEWCWNRFDQLHEDEVRPIYADAWKFHKKYINANTDEEWQDMIKECDEISAIKEKEHLDQRRMYISRIYIAIMHHIDAVNKAEEKDPVGETPTVA